MKRVDKEKTNTHIKRDTHTHTHTHTLVARAHQAASVDTHRPGLLVAGRAVEHAAEVVVEVVAQGQAAQFAGVGAWRGRSSVSGSLV